jgi:FixJ family two-component response regulator
MVLDLVLPGAVSGGDLRTRMLADRVCAAIPTVIVTAAEVEPAARAQLLPAAWLEKPFRFDQLHEVVKQFVLPGSLLSSDTAAPPYAVALDPSSSEKSFHP